MNASVFVQAQTELGDKVEVRFDLKQESLTLRILGTHAVPEYVVIRPDSISVLIDLLNRLQRSNDDIKSESSGPSNGEAETLPGSEVSQVPPA